MSKYLKLSNRILEKREKETKQLELDLKEKEKKEKKKRQSHPNEGMKTSSPLEETSFHGMDEGKTVVLQALKQAAESNPELRVRNMEGNAININGVIVRVEHLGWSEAEKRVKRRSK